MGNGAFATKPATHRAAPNVLNKVSSPATLRDFASIHASLSEFTLPSTNASVISEKVISFRFLPRPWTSPLRASCWGVRSVHLANNSSLTAGHDQGSRSMSAASFFGDSTKSEHYKQG